MVDHSFRVLKGLTRMWIDARVGSILWMVLIAVSRRATALELVSEAPIPRTMSLQPVARVTSRTEMVSSA